MKSRLALSASLLSAWLMWPTAASACPMCFSGTEANRMAFLGTAIVMTLLPLAIISGTVYWVRHLMKQRELEEATELGLKP